jgi:hypothetical protein
MSKTLEEWKEALVGKEYGRLTILDVQQHIRKSTGKKDGFEVICRCVCGNFKTTLVSCLIRGETQSCGCLAKERRIKGLKKWREEHPEEVKETTRRGLENAHRWLRDHPEEVRKNVKMASEKSKEWRFLHPEESKNILEKATKSMLKWCEEHPEERRHLQKENAKRFKEWIKENPEKAKEIQKRNLSLGHIWWKEHPEEVQRIIQNNLCNRSSKEENTVYEYLLSLGYSIERQAFLEGHYFDFKINDFLIEYNGSTYHYTRFENLNNPKSKAPSTDIKDPFYHSNIRNIAINHGFRLIQIWDFDWVYNREFIQTLLKDQLSGIANYKDYIEENIYLNNDYGFSVDGEQLEPRSMWVSTYKKKLVDATYLGGKVLIYNSGYTLVKEKVVK